MTKEAQMVAKSLLDYVVEKYNLDPERAQHIVKTSMQGLYQELQDNKPVTEPMVLTTIDWYVWAMNTTMAFLRSFPELSIDYMGDVLDLYTREVLEGPQGEELTIQEQRAVIESRMLDTFQKANPANQRLN
jgi:hypothetical protein